MIKYECTKCGASGRKLWRQYNTFATHIQLRCARCAVEDAKLEGEFARVDQDGRVPNKYIGLTDQLGGLVPAVPVEGDDTFWGYSSVPAAGVNWWRALPT